MGLILELLLIFLFSSLVLGVGDEETGERSVTDLGRTLAMTDVLYATSMQSILFLFKYVRKIRIYTIFVHQSGISITSWKPEEEQLNLRGSCRSYRQRGMDKRETAGGYFSYFSWINRFKSCINSRCCGTMR